MAGEDPSREGSKIESLGNVQNVIGEQLGNLSGLLDGGINIASDIIRSSTATAKTEVEKAAGLAKEYYQLAATNIAAADDAVMTTLKKGVSFVVQNESASIAAAVGLVAITLPTTRRILWRTTFGRLQSAEAAQRAAEQRLVSLQELIDSQAGEADKLAEQLAVARDRYSKALGELKNAASAMRGLESTVNSTESKARSLMQDLRELRSKHALQMRSELAVKAAAVAKQKSAVEKVVAGLAKDGF